METAIPATREDETMEDDEEEESDEDEEVNATEEAKFLADLKSRAAKTKERFASAVIAAKKESERDGEREKNGVLSRGCVESEANRERVERADEGKDGGEVKGERGVVGNQTFGRDAFETEN